MTDTIRQSDDGGSHRTEMGGAGGSDGGIPTTSITRALMGYATILLLPVGTFFLVILNGSSEAISVGVFLSCVILALSPMIFRLLGRRDIAGALARWHATWIAVVIVFASLQAIVFLGKSESINMTSLAQMRELQRTTGYLQQEIYRDVELANRPDVLFLLDSLRGQIADLENLNSFRSIRQPSLQLFEQTLLLLILLKVSQAFAAWVPWMQRWLTPKPAGAQLARTDTQPAQTDPLAALSNERRWLVRELTQRAARLRTRAAMVLLAIIALILGGIISIYLAGDLVSSDAKQTTRLTQLTSIINDYKSEVAAAEKDFTETEGALATLLVELRSLRWQLLESGIEAPDIEAALRRAGAEMAAYPPQMRQRSGNAAREDQANSAIGGAEDKSVVQAENDAAAEPIDAAVNAQNLNVISEDLRTRRIELLTSFAELTQRRELLNAQIKAARQALSDLQTGLTENVQVYLVDTEPKETDVALLVASAATRFGILIVVIFLVQILVGIYRYSQRLSAFYAARADALTAVLDRKSGLGDWGAEMLPEMIDFGRSPVPPAQYVIDAMRAYFDRRTKRQGGGAEDQSST